MSESSSTVHISTVSRTQLSGLAYSDPLHGYYLAVQR